MNFYKVQRTEYNINRENVKLRIEKEKNKDVK